MIEPVTIGAATLYLGDCRDVMAALPERSVDAVVCDPPYGLGFMGKDWDHSVPGAHFWEEAIRVAKPGAHLVAFGGTRTFHRLMVAIEDAGWEIRDTLMWVYGSGFPKSLDVSKAIDKAAGHWRGRAGEVTIALQPAKGTEYQRTHKGDPVTAEAKAWAGWGTALKPAWEPIILARKPLTGTVAANVMAHGTGALNVDGCRVGDIVETWPKSRSYAPGQMQPGGCGTTQCTGDAPPGRWPANVLHDGSEEVLAAFPRSDVGAPSDEPRGRRSGGFCDIGADRGSNVPNGPQYGDSGSAARFFYCAKADRADRNDGCETLRTNTHPTVKPTDLMRWLCRLVTPAGGVVLDPFSGSGSTGRGAVMEGFRYIGIELNPEYQAIAAHRLVEIQRQGRLIA